jgi:hypothetical protein
MKGRVQGICECKELEGNMFCCLAIIGGYQDLLNTTNMRLNAASLSVGGYNESQKN